MGNQAVMSEEQKDLYLTAIQQGDAESISHFFKNYSIGMNDRYNLEGCGGRTALMVASQYGHWDIVRKFLEIGAHVDLQDENGSSALVWACLEGHLEVVKLLLDRGAKVDLSDKKEWSPLMNASQEGHFEVVKALLESGAQVDLQMKNGWSALMSACERNRYNVAKLLLDKGAEVDLQRKDGWTVLMCSSRGGQYNIARLVLEKGARIDLQLKDGWSALMHASQDGNYDIVKLLLEKGAKVDLQNDNAWTSLMLAIEAGQLKVVKLLLNHGANVYLQSVKGEAALSLAMQQGSAEMIALIEEKSIDDDTDTLMVNSESTYEDVTLSLSLECLILFKWRDDTGHQRKFQLINKVSSRWKDFGLYFGENMNWLEGLEEEHNRRANHCWCKVMSRWLAIGGTSNYPATWEGLLTALDDLEYSTVAADLKKALASAITLQTPPAPKANPSRSSNELAYMPKASEMPPVSSLQLGIEDLERILASAPSLLPAKQSYDNQELDV